MAQLTSYANSTASPFRAACPTLTSLRVLTASSPNTLITNVANDDSMSIVFNSSNGLVGLAKAGKLPVGRQVTIVGRLKSVSETYFDKKSGQTLMRKRPQITLEEVSIPTGGLGAYPQDKAPARAPQRAVVSVGAPAPVDETPELQAPKPFGENTQKDENGFPIL